MCIFTNELIEGARSFASPINTVLTNIEETLISRCNFSGYQEFINSQYLPTYQSDDMSIICTKLQSLFMTKFNVRREGEMPHLSYCQLISIPYSLSMSSVWLFNTAHVTVQQLNKRFTRRKRSSNVIVWNVLIYPGVKSKRSINNCRIISLPQRTICTQ